MYKVSPGEARTDLFGIGKGAAQVVDLEPMREQISLDKRLKAQQEAANKKQQQDREDEIMKNLAISSNVAIRPNDQPYFAKKQAELYGYVEKNIDKLRSGDAKSMMEYQKMLGALQTEAELSKNAREYAETEFQKYNQNPTKYRFGSEKKIGDFLAAPEFAGNWDVSTIPLKENIDYTNRVDDVLSPIATDIMVKSPTRSAFSEEQAYELIKKDLLSDPRFMDQANFEFELDKEKGLTKETDPVEYMANKYKGLLTRNITRQPRSSGSGDKKSSASMVSVVTVTDTKDPKNNWKADIRYEGKNLPYQRVVRKDKETGEEYAQDVIVDKVVKRGNKVFVKVSTKPNQYGTSAVFDIDYDTQDGKVLLAGLGIENPMALFNENQPDVTPTKIGNVEAQKYSKPKTETEGGKPSLKVGDIKSGKDGAKYKYIGGDSKKQSSWKKV